MEPEVKLALFLCAIGPNAISYEFLSNAGLVVPLLPSPNNAIGSLCCLNRHFEGSFPPDAFLL